jgi:predicted pyridoxine 5'-phosphate oxidase superfamily flavin-nucleotide-binding protein
MRHDGELAVQRRAGVSKALGSARVGAEIPPVAAAFLGGQPFVIIGGVADGVWASMLVGAPGFVRVVDERTVVIDAVAGPHDPLYGRFTGVAEIGILAVEPSTRRRIRVNGLARAVDHRLVIHTEQVYGNCPKYIQQRVLIANSGAEGGGHPAYTGTALTSGQREWLARTDTFFIATAASGLGADVSHRGGAPGFVQVLGDRRLAWPDYVGNSMYMTLGNLELSPAAGLLVVDWESGDTLQLSGRATVDWDPARAATIPGAQRVVDFEVEHVIQVNASSALRWRLISRCGG